VTRVDFYVLRSTAASEIQRTACRIAEKAYRLGQKVFLHTASENSAREVDQLLWVFRDGSFIPHELADSDDAGHTPVVIGHDREPDPAHRDLLINLADEVPLFFSRFERVAEIVGGEETQKSNGRERFRFYRDRGYSLNTHELG